MSYTDHTLFFPLGRLSPAFVETYLSRYTDPETEWAAVHWDDAEHTRRRKASLFDNTIDPSPHYDALPPAGGLPSSEWQAAHLDGHTITVGWPDAFLSDLARTPQPEPELFDGITIL